MITSIKNSLKVFIPKKMRADIRLLINRSRYYGWKYKCPVCNSHLRKLNPVGRHYPVLEEKKVVGGGYRPNATCPICGSVDRVRLLYLYLKTQTNVFTDQTRLLHVAPESMLSEIFDNCANVNYLTADLNPEAVMVQMDITDINYPDNSFDAIICNHVLEHIVDDGKAMREIYRVLKPGGWGVLQVPMSLTLEKTHEDPAITSPSDRARMFGQSNHVRLYAMDYLNRLEDAGFEVSTFEWWLNGKDFASANNKFGLIRDETIFRVSKPY